MPLILQSTAPLSAADLGTARTLARASELVPRSDTVAAAEDCAPLTPAALHFASRFTSSRAAPGLPTRSWRYSASAASEDSCVSPGSICTSS